MRDAQFVRKETTARHKHAAHKFAIFFRDRCIEVNSLQNFIDRVREIDARN